MTNLVFKESARTKINNKSYKATVKEVRNSKETNGVTKLGIFFNKVKGAIYLF